MTAQPAPDGSCSNPQPQGPTCMGIVDEAARLERAGKPIVHLEKGELDLDTPEVVKERAIRALRDNRTRYSHSSGLPELRQAIADHYGRRYDVDVDPACIMVNAGSSAAMVELFLTLLEPDEEVVLPDPGYPAYPSMVAAARGRPVFAASAEHGFRHTADLAARHITPATRAVMISFPTNPTGALADLADLRAFADLGPVVIADEVYHGLEYDDARSHTILEFTRDAVAVGSFSKSFAMTGWRLGWLVVPERLRARIARMHEYLFVGTNTFVQWAAVTALEHAETIHRQIRNELRRRHHHLRRALTATGLRPVCDPQGGFYTLVRQPDGTGRSAAFAADLLENAHVALTPGSEFGPSGEGCVRFSLSAPADEITEGLTRITEFLHGHDRPHTPVPEGSTV